MKALREPTSDEIAAAKTTIRRARLAVLRQRGRLKSRRGRNYPTAPYECSWCGEKFVGRVVFTPPTGRYCSESCRQLAYQHRRRRVAKRDAARAAVLARMELA